MGVVFNEPGSLKAAGFAEDDSRSRQCGVVHEQAHSLGVAELKSALDSFTAEPKAMAFAGPAVAFGSAVNELFLAAQRIVGE